MGDERIRELERAAAGGDLAAQAALSQARRREGESAAFPAWRALWDEGADLFAQATLGTGIDGLLDADLEPLGPTYAARVRRFVQDGSDPAVLDALAADPGVGAGMEFGGRPDADHNRRPRDVLCALRDPAALVRLGLVYDALGAPGARGTDAQDVAPGWLIALVLEATRWTTVPAVFFAQRCSCALAWPVLEAVSETSRTGVDGLLRLVLGLVGASGHVRGSAARALRSCAGLGEALQGYPDYLREALRQEGTHASVVCDLIRRHGVPTLPFVEEIAVAATASSATHSSAWSLALLAENEPGAGEPLRAAFLRRLDHPRAEVRWQAVRCLERFRDPAVVPALECVAAGDRSERVRRAAAAALCTLPAVEPAQRTSSGAELPPLEPLDERLAGRLNTELLREGVSGGVRSAVLEWLSWPDPWPSLASEGEPTDDTEPVFSGVLACLIGERRDANAHAARLGPLVQGLSLPHLARFLRLTGQLRPNSAPLALTTLDLLARTLSQRADGRYDLEALADALSYAGLAADSLGRASLEPDSVRSVFSSADGWDPTAYFRKRPQLIDEALRGGLTATAGIHVWAARLLAELERVLLAMPSLEASWVEALVDLGTNTAKAKREFAQRVVDAHEVDLSTQLVPLLSARKGDRRANAARWLARRGVRDALPALREAVGREAFPKVKRALMAAVEELEQG